METVIAVRVSALILSTFTLCVLLLALRDVARRNPFPDFSHGRLRATSTRMRLIWGAAFVVAFLAGGPSGFSTSSIQYFEPSPALSPQSGAIQNRTRSVSWSVAFASYSKSRERKELVDGEVQRADREAVRAPLWLVLILVLYGLVVVRRGERRKEWENGEVAERPQVV